jgi:FkbM family methyltransferase
MLFRRKKTKEYRVGRTQLLLPDDSPLESYQSHWLKYDVALGEVARLVAQKYPDACAIDIGANVGDTAALIRKHTDIPILCIEGNEVFFPYLHENLRRIGGETGIVKAYVGTGREEIDQSRVQTVHVTSTARHAVAVSGSGHVPTRTLAEILAENRRFAEPRLIKIDTDGFDFRIIASSVDVLSSILPVVFYEYDPEYSASDPRAAVKAAVDSIEALAGIGYEHFALYDNFGHLIVGLNKDQVAIAEQLTWFLFSNSRFGTAVYYFDVCAFATKDNDLYDALLSWESSSIQRAKNSGLREKS